MIMLDSFDYYAEVIFLLFLSVTLVITYWAAKKKLSAEGFFTADKRINGLQNGLAISGEYLSVAAFLGISALVYKSGYDGLIYSVGFVMGWPIILFLIAEPLHKMGYCNFTDLITHRFQEEPIRIFLACSSICIIAFYLISQIVGSGNVINILFGIPYEVAIVIVGLLVCIYIFFGGMLATTWIQIVKAVLLLFCITCMALIILYKFHFSLEALFVSSIAIHPMGAKIMAPGGLISDPISAISLGLALMFGTVGLPHILIRFLILKDVRQAKLSAFYATGFISYFHMLIPIISFGAIVFVSNNPVYFNESGKLIGGNNMAVMHLSHAIGGDIFFGIVSAIVLLTVLAVISGLMISGVAAISYDLYNKVLKGGNATDEQKLRASRLSSVVLCLFMVICGLIFKNQNIAYMVGLSFAIAASSIFPMLLLSIYWNGLTTKGVVIGGAAGLASSLALVILGPVVWVDILGNKEAIFPYEYPALFSMLAAFLCTWMFSVMDKTRRIINNI